MENSPLYGDNKAWDLGGEIDPLKDRRPRVGHPLVQAPAPLQPLAVYTPSADPQLIAEVARLHRVIGLFVSGLAHARMYYEMLPDDEELDGEAMLGRLEAAEAAYLWEGKK